MQEKIEKNNAARKSLRNLANLLNVPLKGTWITLLAKELDIDRDFLYSWRNRGDIPENWRVYIEDNTKFPISQWYINPQYQQDSQFMDGGPGISGPADSNWVEVGKTDAGYQRVTETVTPPDKVYIAKVKEILKSQYTSVSAALRANIDQFHDMIEEREEHKQDKERIFALEEKIKTLEKGLKRAENFDCGSAEKAEDAESKG